MRRAMPSFLISMMVILIGLYISIYWIVIRSGSRIDGTLLYLGIFSILLGIWSANETDVAAPGQQAGMLLSGICYAHVVADVLYPVCEELSGDQG